MQNDNSKFKETFIKRLVGFSVNIVKFCANLRSERLLWSVIDQVIRSATSIGANVVEAKSSSSKKDYIHYFEIALKSANETKYWLIVIEEMKPELRDTTEAFMQEATEISNILASGILTMKGKR